MDVEATLREFSIQNTREPEYYRILCPYHNDNTPSGYLHNRTGKFHCFVCNIHKSFHTYLAKQTSLSLQQIKIRSGVKGDTRSPIAHTQVEAYHANIWKYSQILEALRYRCITDEMIRERRLGAVGFGQEIRCTIPIYNEIGECACIRNYLPGATNRKFFNSGGKDSGKKRFYPVEQLEFDQILICAGEMKAILAAKILNSYDIGAVAPTCGENDWPNDESYRFQDKLVYVCSDTDEAGIKSAENRCRRIKAYAREIHKITLPVDEPKGDINDFVRLGGDLYQLLLDSPVWTFTPGGELNGESAQDVSFKEAFHRDNVGKRMKVTAIISGLTSAAYNVPAVVEVQCPRGTHDYCMTCDVNNQAYFQNSNTEMKIHSEHRALLALIHERDINHVGVYKDCFHIPRQCQECVFVRKQEYSVDEVLLDEQLPATSRDIPIQRRNGFIVNAPLNLESQSYILTGRLHPSPKHQISTFLASECEPTQDALEAYTTEVSSDLDVFKPNEWTVESLTEKLDDIYSDLESNVTQIWRRRDYHLAIDLAYHSVLYMDFLGSSQLKGYIELLVVGDTREGKSQTANRLRDHYGLGTKIDCKNVSLAGLTGGVDTKGSRAFALFGVMPKNDKGLLIFEELSGMRKDILQSLTEVRSSGLVQITKIERGLRSARVRIIAISNCVADRSIDNYSFGIDAAVNLIGTNQDLSRFDFVFIIGKSEPPPELENPPRIEHKYLAHLCQKLILKAWKCDDILFDELLIMQVTRKLQEKFGDGPPVLDPNSSHLKVARLAAALAARTNSYEDYKLVVRPCHVQYIAAYLDRIYSTPACRLHEKSRISRDSNRIRNKEGLLAYLKTIPNIASILQVLGDTDIITAIFMRDLVGDFMTGSTLFSRLVQSNAISMMRSGKYIKTSEFIELIKTTNFEMPKPKYLNNVEEKF